MTLDKKVIDKCVQDLSEFNKVQRDYLINKADVMTVEEELIKRTKKYQENWTEKEWNDPEELEKLLEVEEKWEKELDLYQKEQKLYKSADKLKKWALDKIKNGEIEGLPEETRQAFLTANKVQLARINNKLITLALMM